jgi:tRNA (cmo5U34)-methyltransferase
MLVEKVLGATAELDQIMVETYHGLNAAHGYSQDEIERKRLSLEGALVKVTAAWNEELLRMAGIQQVNNFWQWFNFAG